MVCHGHKQQCNCPPNTPSSDEAELVGRVVEVGASRKCKSIEVTCEANELWQANLKLCEQQLAGQECLIGVVEALANVLGRSGLVRGLSHGRMGGGGSDMKGKGKEKAIDGGSEEESGEDDGDGENNSDGE